LGASTTSLSFLVDGISFVESFEKEIIDQRDTLLSVILSKDEHIHFNERIQNEMKFSAKIIPVVLYYLSMGKY
jgi:hypothetical protein